MGGYAAQMEEIVFTKISQKRQTQNKRKFREFPIPNSNSVCKIFCKSLQFMFKIFEKMERPEILIQIYRIGKNQTLKTHYPKTLIIFNTLRFSSQKIQFQR